MEVETFTHYASNETYFSLHLGTGNNNYVWDAWINFTWLSGVTALKILIFLFLKEQIKILQCIMWYCRHQQSLGKLMCSGWDIAVSTQEHSCTMFSIFPMSSDQIYWLSFNNDCLHLLCARPLVSNLTGASFVWDNFLEWDRLQGSFA